MELLKLLVLLVLGILSYLTVRKTATQLADTPMWLLWIALMSPPIVLVIWTALVEQTLPFGVVLIPFLLGSAFYIWLVRRGRQKYIAAHPTRPINEIAEPTLEPEVQSDSTVAQPLTSTEEKTLRNCFPWGVYYLQALDYRHQAILCRGRLATHPDDAYATIRKNIESNFGDRFLLVFQEGQPNKPFFALVPNPLTQRRQLTAQTTESLNRPWLALGLLLVTLFTTTAFGAELAGIPSEELRTNPGLLLQGVSYSVPLLLILGVHELGHYLTACHYQLRATLPYFVPMPFFLGTFGAFTQIRSPMPHRRALFDVALARPLGSFLLSLPILWWGLGLSQPIALTETSNLLNFGSFDPRFSFCLSLLSRLALGAKLTPETAIQLHPLAIAGYVGMIVTVLKLMPVGQLDGGHIIHAMFGQRKAFVVTQVTRLLMVLYSLVQREFMVWALLLILMPNLNEPALNDVTELDNRRDALGLIALGVLVFMLLPLPTAVAQWLAI
ncbi:MAG: site-2 protease family protein [Spirulina sp. SIO3F2]|nr:site-2 protease family protein [Spirulina sp. SIO3F2]